MKRLAIVLALLAALIFCLACCDPTREMYKPEDADRIAQKGREMMQAWLDEHKSGAQLTACEAFVTMPDDYSGGYYLTGYAEGKFLFDGEETDFTIDTLTGTVYFAAEESVKAEFSQAAAEYLYETMGIVPADEDASFTCYVLAPYRAGDANDLPSYRFNYGFDFGLPVGVEDMDSFVRNPQSRPQICVTAEITAADDMDLAVYDLQTLKQFGDACGMHISMLTLENGTQTAILAASKWMTKASFSEHGCLYEGNGFRLSGHIRVREESLDGETGEITASDRHFDPEKDLIFEKTAVGYRYYMPNEDWQEAFTICASEGADILAQDYLEYFYSDVDGFLAGKYDNDRSDGTETVWLALDDGTYVLASKKNGDPLTFFRSGTLEPIQ